MQAEKNPDPTSMTFFGLKWAIIARSVMASPYGYLPSS
ncbi:Uncharacterised protein [Mycobacterium tuberculosis]|nr:Uncharacterised protein [Mycobacterium tuberculosis]